MTVISNRPPNLRSNLVANLVGEDALAEEKLASQFYNSHSGVRNLPRYMTINSVTQDADLIYYGGDASASGLNPQVGGATGNLTLQAGTVPTYNQGSPYHGGPNDDSVKGNAGGYFLAGNNTFGNVATKDMVHRLIFKATGTTTVIAAKRNAGVGWEIGIDAADKLYLTIQDSGAAVTTISAALDIGSIYDAKIFTDRSGSCQIDINGATSGAAVLVSGSALTLDSATALAVLADSAGAGLFDSNIMYFGMWSGAAWLDSHLQPTLVAREYQQLTRTMPDFAKGTREPTAATRAFSAYSEKLEPGRATSKLYFMGDNQIRVNSKLSKAGEYFEGVHLEPQVQNLAIQSGDASTTWVLLDAGDTFDLNAIDAANGETVMDGFIADATDGIHGITQNVTMTAVSTAISCYAKKGNQTFICIEDATIANGKAYFDIDNEVVGATPGAGIDALYIQPGKYNDTVRCIAIITGTAAAHMVNFKVATADNDDTFAGDGAATNAYMWGFQVECNGLGYATSYIPTLLAAATRLKDDLRYAGGANIGGEDIGRGTFVADVLFDEYDSIPVPYLFAISDGGSSADRIAAYIDPTGDTFTGISRATAGNSGTSGTVGSSTDGEIHQLKISYQTNRLIASRDGIPDATADVSCDMPDDLDTIHMGMNQANIAHTGCLMRNIRSYTDPDVEV